MQVIDPAKIFSWRCYNLTVVIAYRQLALVENMSIERFDSREETDNIECV